MTIVLLVLLWVLSLFMPFLPVGWLIAAIAVFLIIPYFEKDGDNKRDPVWLQKLKSKDKKGWLRKGKVIVQAYYRWAHTKNYQQ